ncbi:MAG TPA: hypothetical protein VNQ77_06930 [Frankiaceae bacterium]|nr:hypothetical protein [Frankiaceae bacterium]
MWRTSLAALLALPLTAALAGPAAADTLPSCDAGVPVQVAGVTVTVVTQGDRLLVCLDERGLGGLVVSASNESSGTALPAVSRAPGACADPLVATTEPVEVSVAVTGTSVCVGLNGIATTVTFAGPGYDPDLQVWRTGTGGWIDQAFCAREFVAWHLREPEYDAWVECVMYPRRVL